MGNVPTGNYQITFLAASPNGTPAHKRFATIRVLPGSNFGANATANPDSICEGQSSQLNVSVLGGTSPFTYSWTPTTGLSNPTIPNPIASPSVTTTYQVLVTDAQSHTTTGSVQLIVKSGPPAPGPITGPQTVCVGNMTGYSVNPVNGATSYSWTVPAGDSIISGQNTTSITVKWDTTSGTISVIAGNACGTSIPAVLTVTVGQSVSDLGDIAGPAHVCKSTNATYSVAPVQNATGYVWNFPSGVSINNGQGTNTIYVTWGSSSGDVSVVAGNTCDTSQAATLSVMADSIPETPGTIAGADTVCSNQAGYTYSIMPIPNATHYSWTVPTGASITGSQDTTSIVVDFSASAVSGHILVAGNNDCGDGPAATKSLIVKTCSGIPVPGPGPGITVYPNPARGSLNISVHGIKERITLEMDDVSGRSLYQESFPAFLQDYVKHIDVSTFMKGVYFIKLTDN